MKAKEMIDDLLKRGKIEPNEHVAIQLMMANERLEIHEQYQKLDIKPITNTSHWVEWLERSKSHGLNEASMSDAIREIYTKLNEVIAALTTNTKE